MFDLGWSELLLIGIVALIVVGPKDLPVLFRNVGRFVGKMRGMAREFSRAMEDAADQTGLKDVEKTFKDATSSKNLGLDGLNDAARSLREYGSDTATGKMARDRQAAADARRNAAAKGAAPDPAPSKDTAQKGGAAPAEAPAEPQPETAEPAGKDAP